MRPLKKIIDEVKIDLLQFTDDDRINYLDEYLMDKTDDIRAALIKSVYDANPSVNLDGEYYIPNCCIEVECLTQGCEIRGVTIPSGTVIWQTKNLPNLIEGVGDADLKYLGLDDYQHPFKRVSLSAFTNSDGDIFNKKDIMYHKEGNTAYFKNLPTSGIKFLCALGLWSKPTSVCGYNILTSIYPVPSLYKLKVMMRMDVLKSWGYIVNDKPVTGEDKTVDLVGGKAATTDTTTTT